MHCSYISRIFTGVAETVTPGNQNYCGQTLAGLFIFQEVSNSIESLKKYSENFVDYFPPSKNGMTKSVGAQKLFDTIVVRSKPPIAKIGICY